MSACLLAMGCQPNTPDPWDDLPEPTRVGEHLGFYTEPSSEGAVCAGSLEYIDRYLHELIQIHDAPSDLVVSYYWLPTTHERITELCEYGTACTNEDVGIVTTLMPHEHELVHAVRGSFEFSQNFLEEGAAEVWGAHSDRSFDYSLSVGAGVELASADGRLPISYYGVAGRFSAFLLSDLGQDAFVELGKQSPFDASAAEVDDAFVAVTGMTVSEAAESYEDAGWRCRRSVYRDDSISCAVARQLDCSLAEDDGTVNVEFDMSCDSEHFIGSREGFMWSDFVFTLAQGRSVYLTVTADGGDLDDPVTLTLGSCGVGCEDQILNIPPNRPIEDSNLLLSEGQYVVRIELPADGRPRGKAVLTIRNVCEPRA